MMNVERMLDGEPPDTTEAIIRLIDALRDYIGAETETGEYLMCTRSITPQQMRAGQLYLQEFRRMLAKLEALELGIPR